MHDSLCHFVQVLPRVVPRFVNPLFSLMPFVAQLTRLIRSTFAREIYSAKRKLSNTSNQDASKSCQDLWRSSTPPHLPRFLHGDSVERTATHRTRTTHSDWTGGLAVQFFSDVEMLCARITKTCVFVVVFDGSQQCNLHEKHHTEHWAMQVGCRIFLFA